MTVPLFLLGQNANSLNFKRIESTINIPIHIPIADINQMVNQVTKDLLYEDTSFTDNNNDQFKIKVWKSRPIRLVAGTNQNLLIEVPIKIWAEKGIGTMGIYTYQNTNFETVMYFNTTVALNNNWTIKTTTQSSGYKWVQKPILDFGSVKIPITPIVEKSLKKEQDNFCKIIDQQIAQQLNFQKNILTSWNSFQNPFLINQEYQTWLKIQPNSISLSPLKFYKSELQTTVGIQLYSETFIGQKPTSNTLLKSVPNFELKEIPNQKFTINTTAVIPISVADELAKKQFLNKEFDFKNKKIKITNITVESEENRINIHATTEGAIEGNITISGIPIYKSNERKITLSKTNFKLKTTNFFHKAIATLFKGRIIHEIENEFGIPTSSFEDLAKNSVEESFNKSYHENLMLKGKVDQLMPETILTNNLGILMIIRTEAFLNLTFNNTKI